jgi:hypothetical protein
LVSGLVGTHVHILVLSNNFTVLELGLLMTRGEVLQLAVTPTGNEVDLTAKTDNLYIEKETENYTDRMDGDV